MTAYQFRYNLNAYWFSSLHDQRPHRCSMISLTKWHRQCGVSLEKLLSRSGLQNGPYRVLGIPNPTGVTICGVRLGSPGMMTSPAQICWLKIRGPTTNIGWPLWVLMHSNIGWGLRCPFERDQQLNYCFIDWLCCGWNPGRWCNRCIRDRTPQYRTRSTTKLLKPIG